MEREARCNASMLDMLPIDSAPPLQHNEGNEKRNAEFCGRNHQGIQCYIAAGKRIDPMRDSLIHLDARSAAPILGMKKHE